MGRKGKTETRDKLTELNTVLLSYRSGRLPSPLDQRTALGRCQKDLEASYLRHCGGKPSVTTMRLVRDICIHDIALQVLEAKVLQVILSGGTPSEKLSTLYGNWSDRLFRRLAVLGWRRPENPAVDLQEYLREKQNGD